MQLSVNQVSQKKQVPKNTNKYGFVLKGLAIVFAGQKNPFIIFRSKEIYIYFKTNKKKIPINLLK